MFRAFGGVDFRTDRPHITKRLIRGSVTLGGTSYYEITLVFLHSLLNCVVIVVFVGVGADVTGPAGPIDVGMRILPGMEAVTGRYRVLIPDSANGGVEAIVLPGC